MYSAVFLADAARQVSLEKHMKEQADQARVSAGKSKPDMQPTPVDSPVEAQSLDTPPNPKYPSGVFSIIIVGLPVFHGETFVNIFGSLTSITLKTKISWVGQANQ
jgi:hypothetical protein